jgi:hypothetical protein
MVNGVRGESVTCVDDALQTMFYTLSFLCIDQRPQVTHDMKIEQDEIDAPAIPQARDFMSNDQEIASAVILLHILWLQSYGRFCISSHSLLMTYAVFDSVI